MSDPFAHSINSLGTVGLLNDLDGAQRLLEGLNSSSSEVEATDLLEQIKDLLDITASLNGLATRERRKPSPYLGLFSASDLVNLQSVVSNATTIIEECSMFARALQSSLKDIAHERDAVGYATPESHLRNQAWYDETYQALKLRTEVLRVLFSAINLLHLKNDRKDDDDISAEARSLASTLHYQIALVDPKVAITNDYSIAEFKSAVAAAKQVTIHIPATTNKHFVGLRSTRSFYTGRVVEMALLKVAYEDITHLGQKRFVIYGLGGSGKTEMALKYAEEHLNRYWGVFFVDGSSRKNASGSYAEIATIGGVEPNEKAAKNWLATRDLPWLLIVDNVDDDEIQLDELLPSGTKGCVLITSRNPAHKTYGNVGKRYLELHLMEKEEANELILKAAEEPSPWPVSVKNAASAICHALGFLPLALVHAAKAILLGLCSWTGPTGFLPYNERQRERIRRGRLQQRSKSRSKERRTFEEDSEGMNVFSTYEILYQSMQSLQEERFQDAIELLHVSSYMHFQNIRLDVLTSAAMNPLKEAAQREKEAKEDKELGEKQSKARAKTWSMWFREVKLGMRIYLDTPPPLPAALKRPAGLTQSAFEDEVHVRLSEALGVLMKRSLITRQSSLEDRYSMHPLVHEWIRERPEMSTPRHFLWCQTAMTTLAKSILRPPLGDTDNERSMRRDLYAHIEHARKCQAALQMKQEQSKAIIKHKWLATDSIFGRLQADESARFSRVYSECGDFKEALQLQKKTLNFLVPLLGEDHPITIKITLFVSGTLFELSRVAEATDLQRRAYQICLETMGEDHPQTLEVADFLGSALMLKGRWAEALNLHQKNVEGLGKLYGKEHEKTLKAIRNVARVHYRQMDYEKATGLFQVAWKGMKKRLGETHLETLVSLEDLAMSHLRYEEEAPDPNSERHIFESHERMRFILEQRKERLGKEQPYTLLATLYLAQLKSEMGQHDMAERMIRDGLVIAERNLGAEHVGILASRLAYARILARVGQLEEAEKIFRDLAQKPQYSRASDEDGDHPDRLAALWFLVGCLEKQEKLDEAFKVCETLTVGLREIGGRGMGSRHKISAKVQKEMVELKERLSEEPQRVLPEAIKPVKVQGRAAATW